MVGTIFYVVALLIKKWKNSLMISMEEHVVAIYLGWQHPKKSCTLGTFGHQYSKIVSN